MVARLLWEQVVQVRFLVFRRKTANQIRLVNVRGRNSIIMAL